MKTQKISTKIKILGLLVFLITISIIISNIYLNDRNTKDALIMNIVGKERMLTQRIAKNVFYLYQKNSTNFTELDEAKEEFAYALDSLRNGNKLLGIAPAPNQEIREKIYKIDRIWNNYNKNVEQFKQNLMEDKNNGIDNSKKENMYVNAIFNTNNQLLEKVDDLVTLYNIYAENKVVYIQRFQIGAAFILMILFIYIYSKLKGIEKNAQKFITSVKNLEMLENTKKLKQIESFPPESEIEEVSNSINNFIKKINSAMEFSSNAIEQSKYASNKLEEITNEIDDVLGTIQNNTKVSEHLNKSEDIVIESTEELISSTKKLEKLRNQLIKLKETI